MWFSFVFPFSDLHKNTFEKIKSFQLEVTVRKLKWREMLFQVSPLTPWARPFQLKSHFSTSIIIQLMLGGGGSERVGRGDQSVNNVGVWPEETKMLTSWALHTLGIFTTLHLRPGQGVFSVQNIRWNTHGCSAFLRPQHKLGRVKYAFQTYFIYIQSSKMQSIFCHPWITYFTHWEDDIWSGVLPINMYLSLPGVDASGVGQTQEDLRDSWEHQYWDDSRIQCKVIFSEPQASGIDCQKLKTSYVVTILTKNVGAIFSAHSECLMNTEVPLERFPQRHRETSNKRHEIRLSFRVQKLYEAQFIFETRGVKLWKNPKLPRACWLAEALGDERGRCGWAQWSPTAKVSLSVGWQGRRRGQWMSMSEGR